MISRPPLFWRAWRSSTLASSTSSTMSSRRCGWKTSGRFRDLYQGVLQIGVSFHQIEEDNYRGAVKMLRRGLLHLRSLPPVCQTLDVATVRREARAVHDELVALGPDRLGEYDQEKLRQVKLRLITG